MANANRDSQSVESQELKDGRCEPTRATAAAGTQFEAPRRKRQLEVPEPQLNCWSGGSNTGSSACWDGDRAFRLKSSQLRSPRRCAQEQRSRLTAGAATCLLNETADYLFD
jgi:hypothetical protein